MLITGSPFTYPGHSLIIAIHIMQKYPSLKDALRTGGKYSKALEDNEIPGAGSCVYQALTILEKEKPEDAISLADYFWKGECSGCYAPRYDKGVQEAKELEPLFTQLFKEWNHG